MQCNKFGGIEVQKKVSSGDPICPLLCRLGKEDAATQLDVI